MEILGRQEQRERTFLPSCSSEMFRVVARIFGDAEVSRVVKLYGCEIGEFCPMWNKFRQSDRVFSEVPDGGRADLVVLHFTLDRIPKKELAAFFEKIGAELTEEGIIAAVVYDPAIPFWANWMGKSVGAVYRRPIPWYKSHPPSGFRVIDTLFTNHDGIEPEWAMIVLRKQK